MSELTPIKEIFLQGKDKILYIDKEQMDQVILAFYDYCKDNKIKAELITRTNGSK